MSETATVLSKEETLQDTARRYLADTIYLSLLGKDQAPKVRQVLKGIEIEGVTQRLLRVVMSKNDRFETVDRRWAASVRFGDTRRPFERVLQDILVSAGVPLTIEKLAGELAQVYGRDVAHYEEALPKTLKSADKYFRVGDTYGLAKWLIMVSSDEEEDIIFDSFLSDEQVAKYDQLCKAGKWTLDNIADTAVMVVKSCKEPIPLKILALFAWREIGSEDFDPADFYAQVMADERLIVLSDQKVYSADVAKDFQKAIAEMAQELAALPLEVDEEESEEPVIVTDADKDEIVQMILSKGSASAEEVLDSVLEVNPSDSAYPGAFESLKDALDADDRVMWLGGSRWGKVEVFPEEVTLVPASLAVPQVPPFETPEGDVYDQILEEEGFEGNLKSAVYDPLAEDFADEDPARTMYQANGESQRCVLKYHHKQEGTFPLCQINPDFFGVEPEIILIVLVDEGKRKTCYVNNSTRLIYGLKDFYKDITEVSGAVFYIEKTSKPGEYRFRFDGEIDNQLGIDLNRSLDLLDLKARFESSDMPIYDVITEILGKQGMTFAQLVNDINIVKRCSRLLIASILSSYHAFHTRGKSDQWLFDEKKKSQGFNKTKKKYVKKD